jgi:tetratricopeptide (TPR) repeat protein
MSRLIPSSLASALLLVALSPLFAQTPPDADPLTPHVPVKPATRQELDHLEAVKLYGRGVILGHQNRLIEAMHTFEEALRLDPESAAIHRTLVPLYFALDRLDDALAACRRVLELDPEDFETGYRYARQLRVLGRTKEAVAVLTRTGACPGLKDRLEVRAQVFYDLGALHEDAGELDKAEKSFREVLAILDNPAALMEQGPYNRQEIDSQAAETFERLGRICLKGKKTNEAIEAFHKALTKDPARSARLRYNLAEVYIEQGKLGDALAEVEEYLRSQPQGMDGYELRIKLQQQLGRQADILPKLRASADADKNNLALRLLLAREYRKAGLGEREALPIYNELLKESPTPEVYRGLFEVYMNMPRGAEHLLALLDEKLGKATGDTGGNKDAPPDAAAAAHARAMLAVLRDDGELVGKLIPVAVQRMMTVPWRGRAPQPPKSGLKYTTRLMLANLAGRTRQLDAAENLFRSCLGDAIRRGNEHEVYQGLLMVLSLAHNNKAILKVCEEGLTNAPHTNRVVFHLHQARAYMALGQEEKSLKAANDAVNAAGTRGDTLRCRLERAELFSQANKHAQGIAECQALLQEYNQPGDVHTIRSVLSALHSAAHQYDKAEEQLLLILKDDPDDATANNDLGYLWADQNKKLDEAEKRIRKALELDRRQRDSNQSTRVGLDGDRDNAAYVDSLGWLLFRKGDWKSARHELERASALPTGDDDPVVWDHLGDVYFRLKEVEKAGSAWRKAIELYESGGRRRPDERYQEIKEKLRLLGP